MSEQFRQWLERHGLGRYWETFRANDVDFRVLFHLSDEDLKDLGISLGHRRILLAALADLGEDQTLGPGEQRALDRSYGSEAERRQLTVMFSDLVGSTELSRRLDLEDMREVLRQYQNAVAASVVRYRGYVAKFLGDGVLAYFGWPQAYEDQAEQAVRAGLELVAAVEGVVLEGGERLRARVGIATGEVVVGDLIGDATADAEAVIGETPNLAARLQSIADEGQVVIGSTTHDLVGTAFELEDLGGHDLKGFSEAVHAWVVLGESDAESRFETARGRKLTSLVGREHELGMLRERWELAKIGEGQVVLLSGEAGIGKSRMLQEFKNSIGGESRFHLGYQCSPHHTNSAFHPVVQRLRRVAGFSSDDTGAAKLDKLEALLVSLGEDVGAIAPIYAALLALPGEDRYGPLDLSPQQLRNRTIEILVDQALAFSAQRPVLFVIEDAHWADPSMGELLGELIPRIVDRAVLLLISYRPEYTPSWSGHPHLSSLALNRLGRRQAAEIVQSVAGAELLDALVDRIVARADGVPLYVEELTKSVLESVTGSNESAVDDLIPTTLQSSLVARLDRLDQAKEIAQVGAVVGREFSYDLLAAIANRSSDEIDSALDRLVEAGLVFRRGVRPNATYTFKHALVQDAAYTTILLSRRRRLHARIVEALEAQLGDRPIERIDSLAHHAYQGEIWDKAFSYLGKAGGKAMDRSALREAAAQFENALVASAQLTETREILEQSIDLRFELRNALWALGRFEDILTHLSEAQILAKKLEDGRRMGWLSVFQSASFWQLGRAQEAFASAQSALDKAESIGDLSLEVAAKFYLGCVHVTSGDCPRAESLFAAISESLDGALRAERCGLPFAPSVVARSWLVWALAERGEFDQGMAYAKEAVEIAEDLEHPFNRAHIYYDLGYFHTVKGELDQAVEALEHALALIREWNLTYLSPFIMGFLGHAYALSGRVGEGTDLLQQAVAAYESIGLGLFRALVTIDLGEAFLLAGQVDNAYAFADQGLALARKRAERGHEAYGLRLLGAIAAHPDVGETDTALGHYEAALALSESLGMRPLVAQCQLAIGHLREREGRHDEAQQYIETALAAARAMGMRLGETRTIVQRPR